MTNKPNQDRNTDRPEGTDQDLSRLPLFGGTDDDSRPGRTRSGFALRPLVPTAPTTDHPTPARSDPEAWDWELVADYRQEASNLLTDRLEEMGGRATAADREQLGLAVIAGLVESEGKERVSKGMHPWSQGQEASLRKVLYDALFGLGRLQPLVDDDSVENIVIIANGSRVTVALEKTDGSVVVGPAVADSEEELIQFLSELGSRQNRPFTEARPSLHLRLPGGSRLAASSWVTAATSVVIRRHRLVEVAMEEMIQREACSAALADFLAACVKAGKSIVVAGVQGSGKTTWVRALCSLIPPHEMIGTFETEFELMLHEMPQRHPIVHAWEHRPGSGEIGADGRQAGEFTLTEAIHDSFRFNLDRQIVGEVRGPEVWTMLKAMESGPGSISTTHSRSAEHTVDKLVSCAMEMGPQVTRELAISKLASAVDVVMYLHSELVTDPTGKVRKRRWVEEVLVIEPSPDAAQGYATTPVFSPSHSGAATATGHLPDALRRELVRHGFDLDAYNVEAGRGGVRLA